MKTLIIPLLLASILILAGCATSTHTQSWSQAASTSCSGFLNINCGNVYQDMPQRSDNNVLLAAAILAIGSVLLVALVVGGAL